MPTEITMPRLSDTMSEGTVAKWRKQVGETVAKGEILVEIETDKATMELESFQQGVLGSIIIEEGQTVPIGEPIGLMVAPGEEIPPRPTAAATQEQLSSPLEATNAPPLAGPERARAAASAAAGGRVRVSPLARRLAEEQGVDLGQLAGTGPGGRVTREDVEAYLQGRSPAQAPAVPAAGPQAGPAPTPFPGLTEEEELVPLSSMQRTIANRTLESKAAAPHFYVTSEIDMAEAVALRRSINAALGEGAGVSFNDMVLKAVATALHSFPEVNASYRDGRLVRYKGVHVGFAVAIPDGLVVPVVRNADQKSLAQIAQEARELIEKARNRRLSLQEMEGSTCSISNLGMYDVDQFTGIINQPNAAILAIGSIIRKPVVKDEEIVISDRMRVTLSCDHRVFYGAEAAQFLREVKRILERPMLLVL